MPEYIAPGVFVEEIEHGPKPIEGVATSTVALIGETERGPIQPRFITSFGEYRRHFGDVFRADAYMPDAVKAFFDNGGRRCYIVRIAGTGAASASASIAGFTLAAIGPGTWGNRVFVRIEPGTTQKPDGTSAGFRLRAYHWAPLPDDAAPAPTFDAHGNVTNSPEPDTVEDFDDLSLEEAHPDYWEERVNRGDSSLVRIQSVAAGTALPTAVAGSFLQGGTSGERPVLGDFEGQKDADEPSGLSALELDAYRDVALIHAPNAGDDIANAVVSHCERDKYRFAIIDASANRADAGALDPRKNNDTKYAAFYYPWVWITDTGTGAPKKIPPGGFVCGVYARTDNARGVWKAPANELLHGARELEFDIDRGQQAILNPKGVNCIRRFPGRGIRVWGARTLSSDPLWRYVSVRRLFIFIEASIYRGTQWVVFEPNAPALWSRVKQTVVAFLRTQWREGALLGASEEEAFAVHVGRETMTEDDIQNGRLIIEIGIAPVRPAEFVIFRVHQKTQEND